jgi:hypothetical protein
MKMKKPLLLIGVAAALGCSSKDEGPAIDASRPECENLNPLQCMMPWPSSRYLIEDASSATGRRISIPAGALPMNRWGEAVAPEDYSRHDGFSPMTSMITVFDGELDPSNLKGEDRIPESLEADSPTVLLDAETGERVAHFAELNQWEGTDPNRAAFYLRPAQRLKEGHRYVVGIRGVKRKDGSLAPASPYFAALRDAKETDVTELEARRAAFEDIFAKLTDAGVARAELQQAWDFHTASGASAYADLLAMRDDAMMRVGDRGLGCTVQDVIEDEHNDTTWRKVRGTFTVPLYMETARPGARLNRGPDGRPAFNGTAEAPFEVIIPNSVRDRVRAGGPPARWATYGHGLMGRHREVGSGFQRGFWNRFETIGLATDWWGMSDDDTANVAGALGQLGKFPSVSERLHQGIINTLVLTRSFAGVCSELPELTVTDTASATRSVLDPDDRYYIGISQGSIMGTTVAAVSQDIERFILNVGGISYPIMIIRSVDFPDYNKVIQAWYPTKLDTDLMMVVIASHWDGAEPSTYAPHVIRDPLPNTPAKKVLYSIGRYDAQVPNVSSDIAARTMGLPLLTPSPYEVWRVPTVSAPAESAYVIYDVGADPVPLGSIAAEEDNVAHGGVRKNEGSMRQWDAFMRPDGRVEHFCNGACDPD